MNELIGNDVLSFSDTTVAILFHLVYAKICNKFLNHQLDLGQKDRKE